jgi:hypothetical protein
MKAWYKPKLVVLVRHLPEEAVLQICKVDASPLGGLGTAFGACDSTEIVTGQCSAEPCSEIALT